MKNERSKSEIRHYIVSKGYENVEQITDLDIESMVKEMKKQEDYLASINRIPLITTGYAEWLVKTSRDVAKKYTIGEIIELKFDI